MIKYIEEKAILCNFDELDVAQTLECGQCFRFEKISEGFYQIIAFDRVLYIKQLENYIEFFPTNKVDFKAIWKPYFDLNRDYTELKKQLAFNDTVMKEAVGLSQGLRVLNQDPWEALISFIISQHNAIPNIKRVVRTLSERYGKPIIGTLEHSFPNPELLYNAGVDGLTACKTGFRARYILDACEKALNGEIILKRDNFEGIELETAAIREQLICIKGVGDKVADCVLLYGYGKSDCFPIDVWIKRAVEGLYFDGREQTMKEIYRFTKEKYGENAGFANIYLFSYIRMLSQKK